MTLAEAARGRDNNFHLIRFLAALAVLYGHCYPLAGGGAPPLADWLGIDIGSVAVDVFFVTSGFLVTASLRDRPGVRAFVWARVLRIYPALWGVVVLTVAVLGPLLTTRPAAAYWADPGVVDYLIKCASLWGGIAIHLPGVFEANPYPAAVNGSLWTLPYELRMYAILALLGIVVQRLGRRRQGVLTGAVALIAGVAGGTMLVRHFFHTDAGYFARFAWMFFCGACLQMAAARVPLGWSGLLAGGGVLALASLQRDVFFVAYVLLLGYLVVALAHVPGGVIRRFNRVGDCSYGVYLYAFPVQQTVVALLPGITPVGLLAVSAPLTVALAGLSWICVERRALAFKGAWTWRGYGDRREHAVNGPTVRWEGLRGEAYVMIQVALLVMLVFGPRTVAGLPPWPAEAALPALIGGIALMAAGGLIAALGALRLGSNLTPLPHPKDGATLVVSGLYARVRHPIYLGLILSAFGWALFHQGWLTLGWAALLFVLLDVKSRREERWLADRFPAYADYRRRTRRLIPWLY